MPALKNLSIASLGTAVISLGVVAPVNAAAFYNITGLDFLPSDINDKGEVVGEQYLWQAGKVTDLTTLPGANGSSIAATAINNNGIIVGGGFNGDIPDTRGFISDGSTIKDLGRPGNFCVDYCPPTTAVDINDANLVALNYVFYGGGERPVTYIQDENGNQTEVLSDTYAVAINNNNQVVGFTPARARGSGEGRLWTEGDTTTLIPANAPEFAIFGTSIADINNLGQVVGAGPEFSFPENSQAQIWSNPLSNSIGTVLGTLGGNTSRASGINDSTQVVGTSNLADGSIEHAFLREDGKLVDLNTLIDSESGWELTSAIEINNTGDIIGIGNFNGESRGFIAKAVPEPTSTLGVLGLGMFGLIGWRKRRTK
jgi:probable HAF family extracellular repeat protein